jgi:periplasmic protein TonB
VRGRTVFISAVIHVAVFALAFSISQGRARRRAIAVAVVNGEKKKKPEPKKEPPKPKPMLASAHPQAVTPQAAPPRMTAPTHVETAPTAAPVDTGLEMSNDDGPGIALGGPVAPVKKGPAAPAPTGDKKPVVKKEKVLSPKADNPEEDNCTEAPSKPVPVQRATEIEYTQDARANGVEGRLVLKITIGADGSVLKVEVVSSVEPALDAAAIAAVKTWVFTPSMRCGKAMAGGTFTLARRFELGD